MGNLIRAANRHRFRNLGPPSIAASLWTQPFSADLAGAPPTSAVISISNGGSGLLAAVTPSVSYVSGSGWLAAQVTGSGNAQTLTLTATLDQQVAGTFQALVTLTSSGAANSGAQVTVNATVTDSRAGLQLSPLSVAFTAAVGQLNPPVAQTITATNNGAAGSTLAPLQVSVSGAGASYIGVNVTGSGNNQTITVSPSVPPAEGAYDLLVTVSALNATDSPATFLVNYDVQPSQATQTETIQLSRSALAFSANVGGAAPAVQYTEPGNLGPGTLGPVSVGNVAGTAAAYFAFTVTGTGNTQEITVTPTVPLSAGTYTLTADVTATNASNTVQMSVSYAVAAAVPTMALSATTLGFSQNQGAGTTAPQSVLVTNSSGGTLATCSTGFSGPDASRFQATVGGSGNSQTVSVVALTGALSVGTYTATLTINSAGASNTPVTVALTFTVTAASTIRATTATLPTGMTQNSDGSFSGQTVPIIDIPAAYLNGGSAPVRYVGLDANKPTASGGVTVYAYTEAGYKAAIAAAQRGDVIVIEDYTTAGSAPISFTSGTSVTYPALSPGGTTFTYVMSRKVYMGTFPRAFAARVAASYADRSSCGVLTFDWTGTVGAPIPSWHTFTSSSDCSYWRFVGIEMWNRGAAYGTTGPGGAAVSPRLSDIVRLGTSNGAIQSTAAQVPNHVIFDRCYIHGDWALYPCRNAIFLNANYVGILGCDIGEVYARGNETHGIGMLNCDGPLHVENTTLHDSSCLFITGGGGVGLGSPHLPGDIAFVDCYFWRNQSSVGTTQIDTVKNLFELKFARRVLLTGFVMDGNWTDSQRTAVKLKTTNQAGQGIPWAEVIDVTVWNGIIQNSPEAFGIIGQSEDPLTTVGSQRHDIFNILIKPLDVAPWTGTAASGSYFNLVGPFNGLVIEHVTGFMSFNTLTGSPSNAINLTLGTAGSVPAGTALTIQNLVFKNNISGRLPSALRFVLGVRSVGNYQGTNALNYVAPGYVWANNLITGLINGSSDVASSYPQGNGNKYTTTGTSGGTTYARSAILFTTDTDNNVYGDWTLQGGSPAKTAADDGRDMGVIWTVLNARTARALSGASS